MKPHKHPENYQFIHADSDNDYTVARELFIEYANTLNFDLCFQNFDNELAELPLMYHAPEGGIILVKEKGPDEFAGCVGIRKSDGRVAELKRMYIRPAHRHQGLGEHLLNLAIDLAKQLNYKKIRLDTMNSMTSAIKLYLGKGFKPVEPYRFNPHKDALFYELTL